MSPVAVLVTLAAAGVHAAWNQLLAHSHDTYVRAALGMAIGTAAFLPVALLDRRIEPAVRPLVGASAAFELGYLALLTAAYDRAPMGVVYPIARGSAPVLVLLVGVVVLGQPVPAPGAVGVLLVVAGIVLVRGATGTVRQPDVALALAVGACIAGYTLVDAVGVRYASPVVYIVVVQSVVAAVACTGVVRAGGVRRLRAVLDRRTVAVGIGSTVAYALVLVALTLAPAGLVAAVRETSVVIAVVVLAVTGKEKITRAQLLETVAVCAGVACVVLG